MEKFRGGGGGGGERRKKAYVYKGMQSRRYINAQIIQLKRMQKERIDRA